MLNQSKWKAFGMIVQCIEFNLTHALIHLLFEVNSKLFELCNRQLLTLVNDPKQLLKNRSLFTNHTLSNQIQFSLDMFLKKSDSCGFSPQLTKRSWRNCHTWNLKTKDNLFYKINPTLSLLILFNDLFPYYIFKVFISKNYLLI